jgi:hypothetical protein
MLTTLEEKLNLVMLGARREILSNMNNLSNSRAASASYSKQFNVDPLFFSKKI